MIICQMCSKKIDSIAEMGDHIAETGHEKYRTQDGIELPWTINTELMAGAKWCIECRENFKNNYRFYEHVLTRRHMQDTSFMPHIKSEKIRLDEEEQTWFYGRPHIAYTRHPTTGLEGNLLVICPECKGQYKSDFFIDAEFDKWTPDKITVDMTCKLCGVRSSTPNQNISLRQDVYEKKILELEDQLKKYKERYGDLAST